MLRKFNALEGLEGLVWSIMMRRSLQVVGLKLPK